MKCNPLYLHPDSSSKSNPCKVALFSLPLISTQLSAELECVAPLLYSPFNNVTSPVVIYELINVLLAESLGASSGL